jgi:AraC family transcriptional regulator, transcriptional activator of pobA
VHPNQLNANTKKFLGQSAKTTIDKMLLQEAEYLLLQTAFSVKEIAYELGFQSASHFFRFFKKNKGTSPALYRRQTFENVVN